MTTPPRPSRRPFRVSRLRPRRLVGPLLLGATLSLVALAALLRGVRGEAESRRSLFLRTGELLGWLARDVAASCDRDGFAREGGAADSAPAWRDVLASIEEAVALASPPRLPTLAADPRLGESLRAAIDARRFTPFVRPEEVVLDPWPRRARIFARVLANGGNDAADDALWLEAAIAFAADLRAIGTLDHATAAAEIDDAVALRLMQDGAGDGRNRPLGAAAAATLDELIAASLRRLPRPECVANRETRMLQATVSALADVPPLRGTRLRSDDEPPLPITLADDAVTRLDRLPELLLPLLSSNPDGRALRELAAFRDEFARDLPQIAPLVPAADAISIAAAAVERLDRLAALVRRCAIVGASR